MRNMLLPLLALAAATAPAEAARSNADPEARLERVLAGRVAGEPVDCINLRSVRSSMIIDDTAILYEAAGGTIYVNRPRGGRDSLDQFDVLVTNTHSSQLCRVDVVHLYDAAARIQTGFVFLGEFVPYRKPAGSR